MWIWTTSLAGHVVSMRLTQCNGTLHPALMLFCFVQCDRCICSCSVLVCRCYQVCCIKCVGFAVWNAFWLT